MPNPLHILVIDDDSAMRAMIADFLRAEGYRVTAAALASHALELIKNSDITVVDTISQTDESKNIDLVISDLNMPEMTGLEFISKFRKIAPNIPIVLITAFGSIETAIEAIRKGAFDYATKPFKLSEMSVTVQRALRFRALYLENLRLTQKIEKSLSFRNIIGKSPGMREVFDLIRRVAPATANVLITGESGTGKERIAHAIHDEGPRKEKKFVALNCTSIPESLLESELFGRAKGSFSGALIRKSGLFEEAQGGTIFLDEIGDMNFALQGKLLQVIQDRKYRAVGDNVDNEFDVRIIAATHKDLKMAIKNGTFREDLYYRLSVIPILVPPLRHRKEDIPLLANYFLKKYAFANGSKANSFTSAALNRLMAIPWDGNVRELENVIERAVVLAPGSAIEVSDLPIIGSGGIDNFLESIQLGTLPTLEDIERRYLKFVLEKTGGRKEKAAQILGVNRRTLYRKERDYGLIDDSHHLEELGEDSLDDTK